MKKVFKVTIIILLCIFSLDLMIAYSLDLALKKVNSGQYGKITEAIFRDTSEIIILGSSRAKHHYSPQVVSEKLNASCFNSGEAGQGFLYSKIVLDAVLKRHIPSLVIIDLNINNILDDKREKNVLILLPYCYSDKQMLAQISVENSSVKVFSFLKTSLFNSTIFDILYGNLKSDKLVTSMKGFEPLTGGNKNKLKILPDKRVNYDLRENKAIKYLFQLLNILKEKGIKSVVVISPTYDPYYSHNDPALDELINSINRYTSNIYDFSYDERFFNIAKLYYDNTHLNQEGAKYFTSILAERIKKDGIISTPF
jgi:hypothetical protein